MAAVAGCAPARATPAAPSGRSSDAWRAADEIIRALPALGREKWASLSAAEQDDVVRVAEPFLLKWADEGNRAALAVVVTTFSLTWNEIAPATKVHCTLLDAIVCYP